MSFFFFPPLFLLFFERSFSKGLFRSFLAGWKGGKSYHGGGDIVGDIRRNALSVWVLLRMEVCSDRDALEAVEDPKDESCQYLDLKFVILKTGVLLSVLRVN